MIRLQKVVLAVSFCLVAGGLTACSGNNKEDLRSYVEDVKSRQHAKIEPLPEFAPYETHLYSAGGERDQITGCQGLRRWHHT